MADLTVMNNEPAAPGTRVLPGAAESGYGSRARNAQIADKLNQAADILAAQKADQFRIAAYRRAADSICACDDDLGTIAAQGGRAALEAISGVGVSIAGAIAEMLATGRWGFLEHLKGSADPEMLFRAVPGVGPALAQKIFRALQIRTLEELEVAAHDGRLAQVPGFGHRRAAALRAVLANMLGRIRRAPIAGSEEPPVEVMLDVDREYRKRASAGELIRIAPKRFNPKREAWLPLLHTVRGAWHFTALYSNTARAHQLERIADWVVIYFHKDGHPEGQRTVVTETRGEAADKRIVRGREAECRDYYASITAPAPPPRVARV